MSNNINFYQINLHKAYAPSTELNDLLSNKSTFIVFIQEPASRLGAIKGINRKSCDIIHVGGHNKPRAALCVSKNLDLHPLYHLCTTDTAVALIKVKKNSMNRNIVICSSYFPYDSTQPPPSPEFILVVEYCKKNNLPLLTGIDSNSHHVATTTFYFIYSSCFIHSYYKTATVIKFRKIIQNRLITYKQLKPLPKQSNE